MTYYIEMKSPNISSKKHNKENIMKFALDRINTMLIQ